MKWKFKKSAFKSKRILQMKTKLLLHIWVPVGLSILVSCGGIEINWHKARQKDTIEAYEDFLHHYPQSQYSDSAKNRIAEFKYGKLLSDNTIPSFKRFIANNPNSVYTTSAKDRMNILATSILDSSFAMLTRQKWSEAKLLLESVLAADSTNPIALNNLAVLCAHMGQFEKAQRLTELAYANADTMQTPNVVIRFCIEYGKYTTILHAFCRNKEQMSILQFYDLNEPILLSVGCGIFTKMYTGDATKDISLEAGIELNLSTLHSVLEHLQTIPREKWKNQSPNGNIQKACMCRA